MEIGRGVGDKAKKEMANGRREGRLYTGYKYLGGFLLDAVDVGQAERPAELVLLFAADEAL
jgi:hypothetical protein